MSKTAPAASSGTATPTVPSSTKTNLALEEDDYANPPPARALVASTAGQMYALSVSFVLGTAATVALAGVYIGIGCPSDSPLLAILCSDNHYKYLLPILVPVTAWFVIANWVGWQFFRYA